MKKVIIVLVLTAMVQVASAMPPMHGGGFRGGFYPRTTVVVGGGFYNPYFSPFGFYYGAPYGYPYSAAPYQPTKLDMQVADIRNDYADKIESVKLDKSLTGKERRAQIRTFKQERDQAVLDAKRNYYKS
ncbi:hypothetical protein [Chitinophaga pinensis]|uniref:Uncharacterized protein n=1 Tax=Chitinophaga pinensis TaxID=79329 RepID=A0A5C6LKA5_9BACT|nr:hypothetical protein [Chitinophaga pinensis]TWV93348.1 hypothetical protein FEF09_27115 [Chitinophaga pinensis]